MQSPCLIPRTERQAAEAAPRRRSLIVPAQAIDAQSLIAYADVVVSAGGTMNREAVALGTPVYTIFSGRMGAVDERLIAEGRLRPLVDPGALELTKRVATRASATRETRSSGSTPFSADVRRRPSRDDLRAFRVPGRRGSRLAARAARRTDRVADRRDRLPERAQPPHRPDPEARWPRDLRRDLGRDDPLPAVGRADAGAARGRGGDHGRRRRRRRVRAQPAAEAARPDGGRGDPGAQRCQRLATSRCRSSAASTCARSSSSTSA